MTNKDILEYIEMEWQDLTCNVPEDKELRIGLPNPYVVPSKDAFGKDQFYWDSYFIIRGLVADGKVELAKGMVDNFVYLYEKFKVIPSRNRLYNLGGSQPPLLTSMAVTIYYVIKDKKWCDKIMQVAEQELNSYWLGDNKLESHLFDDGFVRYRDHYMNHITAEHESGWDMTSRFRDRCLDFAPVDLNCLIYKYENDLALYYEDKKDEKKAIHYRRRANHRKAMINQFMWDEKEGFFFDFNEETKKRSDFYSLAGFFPLWIGIVDEEKAEKVREKLVFFEYEGGLVTTQQNSISPEGRQWDWPNGWAPLQLIAVEGLMNYGFEEDAKRVAEKWVKLIEKFYRKNGKIYEKYNVVDGEMAKSERYQNQDGFGWTNAVFLCFVKMFALELDKKNIATVK